MNKSPIRKIGVGWLIDGSGGRILENVLLEIENSRIRSVRVMDEPLKKAWYDIDLCGHTVWPAMVDSHVHLTWSGTTDQNRRKAQLSVPYPDAVATIKRHLDHHLACGITAVRDGGDLFGHTLRFKHDPMNSADRKIDIHAAGVAWHATGRYGRLIGKAPSRSKELPDEIDDFSIKSDHVKVINSGLNSLTEFGKQTAPQFDLETLQQVVKRAHASGRKVMVHANGKLPVQIALAAGCDSIEHGYFMGIENLAVMADKRVVWVPTAVPMMAHADQLPAGSTEADIARKTLEQQLEQLRLARRYGVIVAAGTDSGSMAVWHGKSLAQEIRLLIAAGFDLSEAVSAATFKGATLLGLTERGKLTSGMSADFVAAKGNPQRVIAQCDRPDQIYLGGIPLHPINETH